MGEGDEAEAPSTGKKGTPRQLVGGSICWGIATVKFFSTFCNQCSKLARVWRREEARELPANLKADGILVTDSWKKWYGDPEVQLDDLYPCSTARAALYRSVMRLESCTSSVVLPKCEKLKQEERWDMSNWWNESRNVDKVKASQMRRKWTLQKSLELGSEDFSKGAVMGV